MKKIYEAHSPFLDGLITLSDDVHLVRPYAAAKLIGTDSQHIVKMCEQWKLPYIFDNFGYLIFLDHRKGCSGEGGKFASTLYNRPNYITSWTGRFVNPIGTLRQTCPTCCKI